MPCTILRDSACIHHSDAVDNAAVLLLEQAVIHPTRGAPGSELFKTTIRIII